MIVVESVSCNSKRLGHKGHEEALLIAIGRSQRCALRCPS